MFKKRLCMNKESISEELRKKSFYLTRRAYHNSLYNRQHVRDFLYGTSENSQKILDRTQKEISTYDKLIEQTNRRLNSLMHSNPNYSCENCTSNNLGKQEIGDNRFVSCSCEGTGLNEIGRDVLLCKDATEFKHLEKIVADFSLQHAN